MITSGYFEYRSHKSDNYPYLHMEDSGKTWTWVSDPADATVFANTVEAGNWLDFAGQNGLGAPARREARFISAPQWVVQASHPSGPVWVRSVNMPEGTAEYGFERTEAWLFRNRSDAQKVASAHSDLSDVKVVPFSVSHKTKVFGPLSTWIEANLRINAIREDILSFIRTNGPKVDLDTLMTHLGNQYGDELSALTVTWCNDVDDIALFTKRSPTGEYVWYVEKLNG